MTEQLNLTLSELATANRNFNARYRPVNPEAAFPWEISVKWSDLLYHVTSAIPWEPDRTLLRFIHRYDEKGWFLTMECCRIAEDNSIVAFGPRFDLRNRSILPSTGFTGSYDPAYFGNVTYDGNALVVGMHINYVAFPWLRVFKEAANVYERRASKRMNIVFSSIALDFGNNTSKVNVRWPHTVAFHFSDADGTRLDPVTYSSGNPLFNANAYGCADACLNSCFPVHSWQSFFSETEAYLN